jgi:hypothetical protein
MNVTPHTPRLATTVPGLRVRVGGRALSADVVAGTVLVLSFVVLVALTWRTWGDPSMDSGYDALAASRVAGGDLPYADFHYFYGPLAPLLLGGAFSFLGTSIGTANVLGVVLAAAATALTYLAGRQLAGRLGATLAAALTATAALSSANNSFVAPHTFAAPLAVVLALAAVLLAARAQGRGGLAVAGGCLGLVTLCRLEYAVALTIALGGWLLVRALAAGADRRAVARDAIAVAGPAMAVPIVVYGLFLTSVGLDELLWQNLWPRDVLNASASVVLHGSAPLTAGSIAELALRTALYGAGAAALLAAGVAVGRGGRGRMLVLVGAAGVAVAVLALLVARPETVRFYIRYAWLWVPAGAWLCAGVLLRDGLRRGRHWSSTESLALLLVLFLGAEGATTYAWFVPYPNAAHPSATAYLMPFAALMLVWLHLRVVPPSLPAARTLGAAWIAVLVAINGGLVLHDARDESGTVRGPGGVMTAAPADAGAYQGALDAMRRYTRPGDPVLLAPQMSALYVLGDRTNPLPQLSLLPGALPDAAAERRAIARLGGVRLAITDRAPLDLYDKGPFGTAYDTQLGDWLRRDFVRVAVVHGSGSAPRVLDIWKRRST